MPGQLVDKLFHSHYTCPYITQAVRERFGPRIGGMLVEDWVCERYGMLEERARARKRVERERERDRERRGGGKGW